MAAVLARGEGAVLSHRAAAYKLAILRGTPPPLPETTVPLTAHRRRDGIVIHRVRTLHELDTAATDDNVPITIVARVLLDLAPRTSPKQLTRLCHEARIRHECGPDRVSERHSCRSSSGSPMRRRRVTRSA